MPLQASVTPMETDLTTLRLAAQMMRLQSLDVDKLRFTSVVQMEFRMLPTLLGLESISGRSLAIPSVLWVMQTTTVMPILRSRKLGVPRVL